METQEPEAESPSSEEPALQRPDAPATAVEKALEPENTDKPDLVPRGNPLRITRGLIGILGGGIPAFLLMARTGQASWAIPLGLLFVAIAAWGVMDLLGTFDDGEESPVGDRPGQNVVARTTLGDLAMPLGRTVAVFAGFCVSLWVAQSVVAVPWWGCSILVTGSFIAFVASFFSLGQAIGPWAKDELGMERPLFQRHGFWVVTIGALLYFPTAGLFSLWDPWETHYGEVAREVLARDDWISLWWAQDGWFWSKPILNFWIQALSMGTLGTHYAADQMLQTTGGVGHPEWAVRTPNVLMTIAAMYLLYKGVAKVFGRRAGFLGALVLATMPDWFFLAHQTMTDMPFVAAMTASMGILLYGLNTPEEERVKLYEIRAFGVQWRVSLFHLVIGAVLICAIPQILYLLTRNIELVLTGDGPHGFRFHFDEFRSGSTGNCGLPGNEACTMHSPASAGKNLHPEGFNQELSRIFGAFEPAIQALTWAVVIGTFCWLNWGERRARRIVYIAAWLCAAIATMAKGPAGFALPMICAFGYIATKRRWNEILRLELMSGILVILAVALPWYVAMYVRHGSPFTDRLIFHDMFNRAFSHVHDTNEGDDTGIRFYIWQLGYALFPWTGLAPLGLIWSFRRSDSAVSKRAATGDASIMLVMWFLFAFALFTFMGTKFHHYIFPAVPPVAMLVGVVLDDMLGTKLTWKKGALGALVVSAAIAVYGASRFWNGSPLGTTKDNVQSALEGALLTAANIPMAIGLTLVGLVAVFAVAYGFQREPEPVEEDEDAAKTRSHEELMLGAAALAGAFVVVLVGRDLSIKPEGADQPGAIRLLQLFTYNYRRPWPESLDYNAVLGGFTIVGALLVLALAVKQFRRQAVVVFCAFAMIWGVWGLDVYMMGTSPHWGQRELMETYYKNRKGPDEQLVAYQMNWKGENFYTSNHVPAFVSSGATFQTWLKAQKDKGQRVMYFVTEHSRTGGLRGEVQPRTFEELTKKSLNNKFVLVRVEL